MLSLISVDKFLLRSNDSIFLGSAEITKRESDLTVRQLLKPKYVLKVKNMA